MGLPLQLSGVQRADMGVSPRVGPGPDGICRGMCRRLIGKAAAFANLRARVIAFAGARAMLT
jgi:hypothetical protein